MPYQTFFFPISPKNIFYSNKTIQEVFTQQPLVKRHRKDEFLNIRMDYFSPLTLIFESDGISYRTAEKAIGQ